MIKTVQGDLLELKSGILVHGCNCHGVMGGGIARLIRNKWPEVYNAYKSRHAKGGLQLGDVVSVGHQKLHADRTLSKHLHSLTASLPEQLIVVNAMTQFDFGSDPDRVYVDYDAIFASFARVRMLARDSGLSVHFPLIGCGLAQGKWEEVSARIEAALGPDADATLWVLPQ